MTDTARRRQTALVTGASSGIGLELARLLAADAFDLVIVSRARERLAEIGQELASRHGVSVRTEPADLAAMGAAEDIWARLEAAECAVDVLVNNAGVGLAGPLLDQDPGALVRMLQLNMMSLTTLTRMALPGMRRRGWGRILNVASVAAYQPGGPGMAAYYASKAYVLSLSKGLAGELRGSGVTVTALCPGPTRTMFDERAGAAGTPLYGWLPIMSGAAVARAGYDGMMRGSAVVVPGLVAKLFAVAGGLPPRRIALEINRLLLAARKPG